MTPTDPTRAERTVAQDLDDGTMLREIHRAIFVGDAKVGGAPGLLPAVTQLRDEVAQLKAERSKVGDRVWAAGLGAMAGVIVAWAKSLFPHQ